MKEKTFKWWIIFILLFIWQLPQNLVAIIMMPFIGKLTLIDCRHYSFAFHGERMSGGISLGSFCFLSDRLYQKETAVAHELDGHTVDSK